MISAYTSNESMGGGDDVRRFVDKKSKREKNGDAKNFNQPKRRCVATSWKRCNVECAAE